MENPSPQFYLKSATLDGSDILQSALKLSSGTPEAMMEISLGSDGGTVTGTVLQQDDGEEAGAVIVLVPDSSHQNRSDLLGALSLLFASLCADASPFFYVANNANGTVSVIDAATNTIAATITGFDAPNGIAITPDKTRVYVASPGTGTIYVVSTATNKIISSFTVQPPGYASALDPWGMVFSPDGTKLYVATYNGGLSTSQVVVINPQNNSFLATITGFDAAKGLAITPDGNWLYVANSSSGSNSVAVVSTATDTITEYIFGFSQPAGVAINEPGTYAYVPNPPANAVSVLNLRNNSISTNIFGFSGPSSTKIAPSGTVAYEADGATTAITEFSTATNTVLTSIDLGLIPHSIAMTPDGSYAYVTAGGYGAGAVEVINTSTNSVVDTITGVDNPAGIALLNP